MLMALLLPDPEDEHCPAEFKTAAPSLLGKMTGKIGAKDADLRAALLHFIGDFADWDNSSNRTYLEIARGLVKAAQPEEMPLVVDPFVGGGSIPLEALRLGCDAFASDLNPVACLINKVLLEDIPRYGAELAEELRRVGAEVKKAAEKELVEFYPKDPDGARPIAYLWARTVRCETPNCGAEIPLMRSFWLCKKAERRRALRTKVVRPPKGDPHVELEVFTPKTEKDVRSGTVSRAKASCVCCNAVLAPERVRAQLAAHRGGADVVFDAKASRTGGATLLAVVTMREGQAGRQYRLPTAADYAAVWKAQQRLKEVAATKPTDGLSAIPDEPLPPIGTLGFRVQRYGMTQWGDLFTARQKLALVWHISACQALVPAQEIPYARGLSIAIAATISKMTDTNSVICTWQIDPPRLRATFSRQALPATWDYAEACPLSETAGNHLLAIESILEVLENASHRHAGNVEQADAADSPLPDSSASVWFTDPPYYDAVPYADLSDYFFVWLKRLLPGSALLRDPFDPTNLLSPKIQEAVQDETKKVNGKPKDRAFFEQSMAQAFAEGRRVLREDGIASVVFAHKTTKGWEALLSGLIQGGWTITGSWPIATEMGSRLRARDSAALATSVHLICRPRPEDASIGDWGQVLRELPKRVADWMTRLQEEGVRGADLVFACIGPALEVFSRYSKVVDAEEREIPLGGDPESREPHKRGFLAYVWEVVGRAGARAGTRCGGIESPKRCRWGPRRGRPVDGSLPLDPSGHDARR